MSQAPSYYGRGAPWGAAGVATPGAPLAERHPKHRYLLMTVMTNGNPPSSITDGNGNATWGAPIAGPVSIGTAETAGAVSLWVYGKWGAATGDHLDDAAILGDGGDMQFGVIHAYDDVDPTNPVNVTATGSQDGTSVITMPGVTTTIDDCLVTHHMGFDRDINTTANWSGPTNANLTGLVETYDQTIATGLGGGIGNCCGLMETAGATGDTTGTQGATTAIAHITVALNPGPDLARVEQLAAETWGEFESHAIVDNLWMETWYTFQNAARAYGLLFETWYEPGEGGGPPATSRRKMSFM